MTARQHTPAMLIHFSHERADSEAEHRRKERKEPEQCGVSVSLCSCLDGVALQVLLLLGSFDRLRMHLGMLQS
jgi:hypothetical protein